MVESLRRMLETLLSTMLCSLLWACGPGFAVNDLWTSETPPPASRGIQDEDEADAKPLPPGKAWLKFTHNTSQVDTWPFGLDEISTKIACEPEEKAEAGYWTVRYQDQPGDGGNNVMIPNEILLRFRVSPELGPPFAPGRGVNQDYTVITGDVVPETTDEFEVEVPGGVNGFSIKLSFRAESHSNDGLEPPEPLFIELLSATDVVTKKQLELGKRTKVRWLIVNSEL